MEFPPLDSQPGAVGDKDYSPFVQIVNAGGVIYNAPIVAFGVNANDISFPNGNVDYSKVHDQVVAIDPVNMTVTINLINGFFRAMSSPFRCTDSSKLTKWQERTKK
jgi:hypothetical protein